MFTASVSLRNTMMALLVATMLLCAGCSNEDASSRDLTLSDVESALLSVPNDPKTDRTIAEQSDKALPLIFEAFKDNRINGVAWHNATRLLRLMSSQRGFDKSAPYIRQVLNDESAHKRDSALAIRMCYWLWNDPQVLASVKDLSDKGGSYKTSWDVPGHIAEAQLVAYARGYSPGKGVPLGLNICSILERRYNHALTAIRL